MAYLVLIETTGNQKYIFSTNRLRENRGGSENVFKAGVSLVVEAVLTVTGSNIYKDVLASEKASDRVRRLVEIGKGDAPLEQSGVEIVISTSGKAVLLVEKKKLAEDIIWEATRRVLQEYPGLTVIGKISEDEIEPATATKYQAHECVRQLHKDIEGLKVRLPSPLSRFPNLPYTRQCSSSSLPANCFVKLPGQEGVKPEEIVYGAYSTAVLEKRKAGQEGLGRVAKDVGEAKLARSPDVLERMDELDWRAIVHADGNGFGKLFLQFDKAPALSEDSSARGYFNLLRRFSASLELCGLVAFKEAFQCVETYQAEGEGGDAFYPVVPLVLGGDDLTVVMDGRQSLQFTEKYLQEFEKATVSDRLMGLPNAIRDVTGGDRLGAGAGIAIVKPHFPFHLAYELAESLLKSAKQTKTKLYSSSVSSLDFHVLFDSSATNLEEIRDKLRVKETGRQLTLTMRPFIVSSRQEVEDVICRPGKSEEEKRQAQRWMKHRLWEDLKQLVGLFDRADEGKVMPPAQLHILREALYQGKDVAEARFRLVAGRYDILPVLESKDWKIFHDMGSVSIEDGDGVAELYGANLLDVLEVLDLRKSNVAGGQG